MSEPLQAEVIFYDADDVGAGIRTLRGLGFDVEQLSRRDEAGGTTAVWLKVSVSAHHADPFDLLQPIVERLGGDVLEADLNDPKPPPKENTVSKVSDLFPSPMVRALELGGPRTAHILGGLRQEFANGASFYVLDIDLEGVPRVMRCGPMLAREIESVLGEDETGKWIGHAISIFPGKLTLKDKDSGEDKTIDVIRAAAAPAGTAASKLPLTSRRALDDDITF